MGCPDWPKCFGQWLPPLSLSQLPADIDPSTFNATLAWIEWTNRLVGMTVGFLILGVAILALRYYREQPGVLYPSLFAALLVAFQGWQGSVVVASELKPLIVSVHLVLALLIVCLLIYAVLRSYQRSSAVPGSKRAVPKQMGRLSKILWFGIIGQIILGSQVRQVIESASAKFPNAIGLELLELAGAIKDGHTISVF